MADTEIELEPACRFIRMNETQNQDQASSIHDIPLQDLTTQGTEEPEKRSLSRLAEVHRANKCRVWGKNAGIAAIVGLAIVFAALYLSEKHENGNAGKDGKFSPLTLKEKEPVKQETVFRPEQAQGRHGIKVASEEQQDGPMDVTTVTPVTTTMDEKEVISGADLKPFVLTPSLTSTVQPIPETTTQTVAVELATMKTKVVNRFEDPREQENYGTKVGPLANCSHMVSGQLFVVSGTQLLLRDFTHDGTEAEFWAGTSMEDKQKGFVIPISSKTKSAMASRMQRFPLRYLRLGVDLVLEVPRGRATTDLKYFSVRGRQGQHFGTVYLPENLTIPRTSTISEGIQGLAHNVSSSTISLVDQRTILIDKLFYDGRGDDAFFFGTKTEGSGKRVKFPDEKGKTQPIRRYSGETIRLSIPSWLNETWKNFSAMSIESRNGDVFGRVNITLPLVPLPPSIDGLLGTQGYGTTMNTVQMPSSLTCQAKKFAPLGRADSRLSLSLTVAGDPKTPVALYEVVAQTQDSQVVIGLLWGISPGQTSTRPPGSMDVLVDYPRAKAEFIIIRGDEVVTKKYVPLVEASSLQTGFDVEPSQRPASRVTIFAKRGLDPIRVQNEPSNATSQGLSVLLKAMDKPQGNAEPETSTQSSSKLPEYLWVSTSEFQLANVTTFGEILNHGSFAVCNNLRMG